MPQSKMWLSGFYAGVCSALCCVQAHEGEGSVLYEEIVQACGGESLARHAKRAGNDEEAKSIRTSLRAMNARRRRMSRATPDGDTRDE